MYRTIVAIALFGLLALISPTAGEPRAADSPPDALPNVAIPSPIPNEAFAKVSLAGGRGGPGLVSSPSPMTIRGETPGVPSNAVTVATQNEGGETTTYSAAPRREAAPVGQVNYYGITPVHNYDCSGVQQNNVTRMVITAISVPVTYALYNLTSASTVATGTLNAKGAQAAITALPDGSAYKLATSKPVQAYMGFDCSGTLPGSLFYLADDGMLNYGLNFTVPLADFSDQRLQYWVLATGAGTVTVNDLSGATVAANTFAAAGAWMIPYASIAINTVYTVSFVPSAGGAMIAVQQSSQNSATDVPATTQAAGSCTVTNVGRMFYVDIQQYDSSARIVVFPYGGTGTTGDSYTVTPLTAGGTGTFSVNRLTAGTLNRSRNLNTGAYRITSTVDIGVIAGSPEGGTSVWDMGDDAFYYHGNGTEVRGHALRCGGVVFIAQDGTTVQAGTGGSCTPGNPCGLPTLPVTLNADQYLTITGNTANTNSFNLKTQDNQHTILVEVFGGNCSNYLNDWSKILQPAALGQPTVAYPSAGSPLLSTTPLVAGTGIPGATITLFVTRVSDLQQVFTGTTTADSGGAWTIQVTTTLSAGVQYYFDATQSLGGACSATATPTPGSSGSSGVIDVTPPTVTSPADGSVTNSTTPTLAGTAPPSTSVTLTIIGPGGPYTVTTTADGSGAYSVPSPALPQGTFSISATARDGAGNVSSPSAPNSFTVETTPPTVMIDQAAAQADPTNVSPIHFTVVFSEAVSDFATGDVTLSGTAGATAATVTGGGTTYDVAVSGMAGSGTVIATLAEGVAHDAAGNGNAAPTSTDNVVTYDITPPAAPMIVAPADGSTQYTDTPEISGTAEANSTVAVFVDGALAGTVMADGAGAWSYTPPSLSESGHNVYATATDAAGNLSQPSGTIAFTIDVPPGPPSNLSATPDANCVVTLTWSPSPAQDLSHYSIYHNGGSGPVNYAAPVATVQAPTARWVSSRGIYGYCGQPVSLASEGGETAKSIAVYTVINANQEDFTITGARISWNNGSPQRFVRRVEIAGVTVFTLPAGSPDNNGATLTFTPTILSPGETAEVRVHFEYVAGGYPEMAGTTLQSTFKGGPGPQVSSLLQETGQYPSPCRSSNAESLVVGAEYVFGIRAVDTAGQDDGNMTIAIGSAACSQSLSAGIQSPKAGQKIRGTEVTVYAEITLGNNWDCQWVQFEYRPSGGGMWSTIPAAGADHLNPDVSAPYFIYWDFSAVPAESYDVRAVAHHVLGYDDPSPPFLTATVVPSFENLIEQRNGGARHFVTEDVAVVSTGNRLVMGDDLHDNVTQVWIPQNALTSDTKCTAAIEADPGTVPPAWGSSMEFRDLSLASGQTVFANGKLATMNIPVNDADHDRIIDGTATPLWNLKLYSWDGSQWLEVSSSQVDLLANVARGATSHFTLFAPLSESPQPDTISPRAVERLMVTRSGRDLTFVWDPVLLDVTGSPESIHHYNVYRSTTANFVPDRVNHANLVGISSDTGFFQADGVGEEPLHFYLVTAVDRGYNEGE